MRLGPVHGINLPCGNGYLVMMKQIAKIAALVVFGVGVIAVAGDAFAQDGAQVFSAAPAVSNQPLLLDFLLHGSTSSGSARKKTPRAARDSQARRFCRDHWWSDWSRGERREGSGVLRDFSKCKGQVFARSHRGP